MTDLRVVIFSVLLALASSPPAEGGTFEVVSKDSPTGPVPMRSVQGASSVDCAMQCAQTGGCLGFSWLRGLCGLFNESAFSESWASSAGCEVFKLGDSGAPDIRKLNISSCSQSTIYLNIFACSNAIDGNKDPISSYCFTNAGANEWWQANLTAPSFVSYLTIYNRNSYPEWLTQFSLLMDEVECNRVNLTVPFLVANFSCNAFGSSVRLLNLMNNNLVIVEVEAFGY